MPEHEIRYPFKWWRFYAQCLRYATTGVWGVIGDSITGMSIAAQLFKIADPRHFGVAAAWLKMHSLGEELFFEVPLTIGGLILLGRLVTAPFILYRDKPVSAVRAETLRARTLRLSAEIAQFAAMRRTTQPHRGIIRAARLFGEVSVSELAIATHAKETAQQYSSRFLEQVNDIREEFSELGIIDAQLDRANSNPAMVENIETIGSRLTAIATMLLRYPS
jgi:hypothetical protein